MTETVIDLPNDDTDFLRDLIQDAAQRLMDIEVAAVCGVGHGEPSPDRENQRNGRRTTPVYQPVPNLPPQHGTCGA